MKNEFDHDDISPIAKSWIGVAILVLIPVMILGSFSEGVPGGIIAKGDISAARFLLYLFTLFFSYIITFAVATHFITINFVKEVKAINAAYQGLLDFQDLDLSQLYDYKNFIIEECLSHFSTAIQLMNSRNSFVNELKFYLAWFLTEYQKQRLFYEHMLMDTYDYYNIRAIFYLITDDYKKSIYDLSNSLKISNSQENVAHDLKFIAESSKKGNLSEKNCYELQDVIEAYLSVLEEAYDPSALEGMQDNRLKNILLS